jgi:hypothetical protein
MARCPPERFLMGEAKRRQQQRANAAPRLPDFIFGRDKFAEEQCGFLLAGRLVTDIPKDTKEPSNEDQKLIGKIIQALLEEVRNDPHLQEVGIWRGGVKPDHRISPPFPDDLMIARMKRCIVVGVRVDPRNDGMMRFDDGMLAEILGRH